MRNEPSPVSFSSLVLGLGLICQASATGATPADLPGSLPSSLAPPSSTVHDGLHLLRQGRLREAEPLLARGLLGPAPDRIRAGEALVALAMRAPFPWKVRARWRRGTIGGLEIPPEARRLMELELALVLEERGAAEGIHRWAPEAWSPEQPKLLHLVRRYLDPEEGTRVLETWIEGSGGAARAGEALAFALGELLEERGLFARAARIYRDQLRGRDVLTLLDEWSPEPQLEALAPLLLRIRRTHRSRTARKVLRNELMPDLNLGWVQTVRGWSRLAWVLQHLGDTAGAETGLRMAEQALPRDELLVRLELAGLSKLLGRPGRASRLYQAVLRLPPGGASILLQSLSRRGEVLAMLGASRVQSGDWEAGVQALREAARLGADLTFLPQQLARTHAPPGALAGLAEISPARGLGLFVARSMVAGGAVEEGEEQALRCLRQGPATAAVQTFRWLLDRGQGALALAEVRRRPSWLPEATLYLRELRSLAPSPSLAGPLAAFLSEVPTGTTGELPTRLGRLLLHWHQALPDDLAENLRGRLPPAHQAILAAGTSPSEPPLPPRELGTPGLDGDAVEWWTELVMTRGWRKLARRSLDALDLDSLSRSVRRTVLLARARLEALEGEPIGALLRGLQALECAPGDPEVRDFLVQLLEDRAEQRRILHAWAAHVDNDHRFALPLADLWAASDRPRRGITPLRAARAAAPRSPRIASRLGSLLMEAGKNAEALPHLLAAARLWGFSFRSEYAGPLAEALARSGRRDQALRLFHFWLRGPRGQSEVAPLLRALASEVGFEEEAGELLRRFQPRSRGQNAQKA